MLLYDWQQCIIAKCWHSGFNSYNKIAVRDRVRTCAKILAYVTYLSKYQKTCKASYLLPSDFRNNFS